MIAEKKQWRDQASAECARRRRSTKEGSIMEEGILTEGNITRTGRGRKVTPKPFTPEYKLEQLLKFKIEIQDLEEENKKDKEVFTALRHIIRSRSQKIGEMRKTLFEMI